MNPRAPSEAELRASYAGRRVFVTGHTGFKGAWLLCWLRELGAEVTGYALAPESQPALFDVLGLADECAHTLGDVRELSALRTALAAARPDVVFHLAAQSLVRPSYARPLETIETNVLGTATLLEALRAEALRCAVVVVTSDKCYENREWLYGYREDEPLGGHDVYSMSKAAAELACASYRRSFFPTARLAEHGVALATARAGNVVGGGDWAKDRLVPDAVRAFAAGEPVALRNPEAIRPWQHVLEPLGGYLLLAARLAGHGTREPEAFCEAWNFGPTVDGARPVREAVAALSRAFGRGTTRDAREASAPHEAGVLRLSIEKAAARLGWSPRWDFAQSFARAALWYRAYYDGSDRRALRALCAREIVEYMRA
jgi:CDP-glucose 4,6-dehydratase